MRRGVTVRTSVANTSVLKPLVKWSLSLSHACPSSPSLVLGKVGEGSSADGCSELGADGDNRDWLPLLLVSLPRTAEWLLPLLWMGLEVQSSPGCFFWMSGHGQAEANGQKNWFKIFLKNNNNCRSQAAESADLSGLIP